MNSDVARWFVGLSLSLLGVLALVYVACRDTSPSPAVVGEDEVVRVEEGDGWKVTLYLPGPGVLNAVAAEVPVPPPGPSGVSREAGRVLVATLLEMRTEGSLPAVPGEVSAESFDLTRDGVAYVGLGGTPPALGTRGELLSVYSLVNTVAMNVTGVRSVVLLWNGQQRETFAGHIDTTRSLKPRENLVAASS